MVRLVTMFRLVLLSFILIQMTKLRLNFPVRLVLHSKLLIPLVYMAKSLASLVRIAMVMTSSTSMVRLA